MSSQMRQASHLTLQQSTIGGGTTRRRERQHRECVGVHMFGTNDEDCILLVKSRNRQYSLRLKRPQEFTRSNLCSWLAQAVTTVSWTTPGNCEDYWKGPGRPSEKLGGRTAPTFLRGYPGPQTMPKYRIHKTTHHPHFTSCGHFPQISISLTELYYFGGSWESKASISENRP